MKSLALLGVSFLCSTSVCAGTVTLPASKDNTMYAENGALSNGAGPTFFAGTTAMNHARRGLIAFDIAGSVPPGSTITSVRLELSMSLTIAGPVDVSLHRALADWGQGTSSATSGGGGMGAPATTGDATWTMRFFPATPWTNPGGDFAATPSVTASIDQVAVYTFGSTPAMVADVQGWLDQPAASFGWVVIADESTFPTAKRFDSREEPTGTAFPQLIVDYAPPCSGATSYCTATANSTGQPAQIGSSGSTSIAANSFALNASSVPAHAFGLFYYGSGPTQTPFGNGFQCVSGSFTRLDPPLQAGAAGSVARRLDFTQPPANAIAPGSPVYFQFIYRDPASGGARFNTSNGLSVAFCP